jgi:hypothetical protein
LPKEPSHLSSTGRTALAAQAAGGGQPPEAIRAGAAVGAVVVFAIVEMAIPWILLTTAEGTLLRDDR